MSKIILRWQESDESKTKTIDFKEITNQAIDAIRLGRDPRLCHITFSDPRVSRLQAQITWNGRENSFYLQNLRETNPILIGDQQLFDKLRIIDNTKVVIGNTEILFNVVSVEAIDASEALDNSRSKVSEQDFESAAAKGWASNELSSPGSIGHSQLIPLSFLSKRPHRTSYFIPGILAVILVVLLFATIGNPILFNLLLAVYLGSTGFYLIYRFCHKSKPWWVIGMPIVATPLLLFSPAWAMIAFIFRNILPGRVPDGNASIVTQFIGFFFGAGLAEELLKALPIFALIGFPSSLELSQRQRVGVTEPLDGIILGAASGLGFTLLETLYQYVPDLVMQVSGQLGEGVGEWLGLQLLIPRIASSVFVHMAYSGCLGYYIGLSCLKPSRCWSCLTTGYLISAGVHALWNTSNSLGWIVQSLVGILAYCLLIGSILKARQISQRYSKYV